MAHNNTYPQRRRVWPMVALVAALTFCVGGTILAIARTTADEPGVFAPHNSTTQRAQQPKQPTQPAAQPAVTGLGAGTWSVPGEVKPGTYVTTADGPCYWARLKDFDGELTSISANGNLTDGDRGRVSVKAGDKGLELSGNCVWKAAK